MRLYSICYFFLLFAFLLIQQLGSAQIRHELKTSPFVLLQLDPDLSWEINTQKRWSFSLGLRYTFTTRSISLNITRFDSISTPSSPLRFKEQFISFSPTIHFFFSKEKKNYGLYTGINNTTAFNTYVDPTYTQFYKEQNLMLLPEYRIRRFFIGVPVGYKWLALNDRLVIDLSFVSGFIKAWWRETSPLAIELELWIRAGYRFPLKSKKEKS